MVYGWNSTNSYRWREIKKQWIVRNNSTCLKGYGTYLWLFILAILAYWLHTDQVFLVTLLTKGYEGLRRMYCFTFLDPIWEVFFYRLSHVGLLILCFPPNPLSTIFAEEAGFSKIQVGRKIRLTHADSRHWKFFDQKSFHWLIYVYDILHSYWLQRWVHSKTDLGCSCQIGHDWQHWPCNDMGFWFWTYTQTEVRFEPTRPCVNVLKG